MGRFGTPKKDVDEEVGDGMYLRSFRKGQTLVRFLTETDVWLQIREHFNEKGRSFPCTKDAECPGCNSEDEKVSTWSRRYAVNLLVLPDKGDEYVAPYRIPMGLAETMFGRAERLGTVTDRDYVVVRSGQGLNTKYNSDPEDKYEIDISKHLKEAVDLDEVLEAMFEANAPKASNDEPRSRRDSADDDEPSSRRRRRAEESAAAEVKDEEVLPTDAEAKSESAGDSVEVIDEDLLYEMTIPQLKEKADFHGLEYAAGARKADLIKLILASAK